MGFIFPAAIFNKRKFWKLVYVFQSLRLGLSSLLVIPNHTLFNICSVTEKISSPLLSFLRVCISHEHLRGVASHNHFFKLSGYLKPMQILIETYLSIIIKGNDFLFILLVDIRH